MGNLDNRMGTWMTTQFSVAVHFFKLVIDYIQTKDVDVADFLHKAGLHEIALQEPNDRIPFDTFSELCEFTAFYFNEPNLGLKLGESIRPGHLGSHGFALMSCSNVTELIQQHIRYSALTIDALHIEVEKKGDEYIRYCKSNLPNQAPLGKIQEQLNMATTVALSRWFVNRLDLNPQWISFQHDRPENIEEYQKLFNCPISFSQSYTAIGINAGLFNLSLPGANPQLKRIMDDLCAQLIKKLGNTLEPAWLAQARQVIIQSFQTGLPEIEIIAQEIHLTEEEFKNLLSEREMSFRGFVDELRYALALGYVRDPALNLVDISYLLGFSEQSAFQRAFKRWTGMTPGEYRRNKK